jgi:hypothetical protein
VAALWALLLHTALCRRKASCGTAPAPHRYRLPIRQQTVRIAPVAGGISHNTYTQFNVGKSGADLINNGVTRA